MQGRMAATRPLARASPRGRGTLPGRRTLLALVLALLGTYVVASWSPFTFEPPFRAEDVRVGPSGAWTFTGRSLATSMTAPAWLSGAVDRGELHVSVEVSSASGRQDGPARILTISEDTLAHSLLVGQAGPHLAIRARRPGGGNLGMPEIRVRNVFASSDRRTIDVDLDKRSLQIRVDGRRVAEERFQTPVFATWDQTHVLSMGNERSWDRPWAGTVHAASVRTGDVTVDLLDSDLQRTWDGALVLPGRLGTTDRPTRERIAVWGLHLLFATVLLKLVAWAWPRQPVGLLLGAWTLVVLVVNTGKLFIGDRHLSVVTTILQIGGGVLGAALARRGTASPAISSSTTSREPRDRARRARR